MIQLIDHIRILILQKLPRQLLRSGCNDLGGTLMDENISRAAGAAHGQKMSEDSFGALVSTLGRPLEQRTTLYGRAPGGRELTNSRA